MSNNITVGPDKLKSTPNVSLNPDKRKTIKKEEVGGITFNPIPLFSPRQLVLSSDQPIPEHQPVSFVLAPVVENGNIQLKLQDVEFNNAPPNPVWKVRNATVNANDAVSIVMGDNLGNLLVLTGAKADAGTEVMDTWSSQVAGTTATGTWSSLQLGGNTVFCSRFSWTFLLDPGENTEGDEPTTVILEFNIFVGVGSGFIEQVSSFPSGWTVTGFENTENGILLEMTGPPPDDETYCLKGGLFVGGLDALVCQGTLITGGGCDQAGGSTSDIAPNDGGTWTGTSGGPV